MDFSNRNTQAPGSPAATAGATGGKRGKGGESKLGRIGVLSALVAIAVLVLAVIAVVSFGGSSNSSEDKYVDSSKLQAVFLNTGQVYFGNIKTLDSRYFVVSNIYYLQTANSGSGTASSSNTSVSLVKLGCELHEPYDQMVINRDQVTFWENLQDNGQVAKAVDKFKKDNPSGQKCADQSSSSSSDSSNNVQSAGSSNSDSSTGTTPKSTTTNP